MISLNLLTVPRVTQASFQRYSNKLLLPNCPFLNPLILIRQSRLKFTHQSERSLLEEISHRALLNNYALRIYSGYTGL